MDKNLRFLPLLNLSFFFILILILVEFFLLRAFYRNQGVKRFIAKTDGNDDLTWYYDQPKAIEYD
jgi:purine-cytosine permease-like protein